MIKLARLICVAFPSFALSLNAPAMHPLQSLAEMDSVGEVKVLEHSRLVRRDDHRIRRAEEDNPQQGQHDGRLVDGVWTTEPSPIGKCNAFSCPTDYYLRMNSPNIRCAGETCTEAKDLNTCCVALTKEMTGKKCHGAQALNWLPDTDIAACLDWAINNGARFFLVGKGEKQNRCWWQLSDAPKDCTGEACCKCSPPLSCEVVEDEYDFFKLA